MVNASNIKEMQARKEQVERQQEVVREMNEIYMRNGMTLPNSENDALKAKLNEATAEMQASIVYFRGNIDHIQSQVMADGVVTRDELGRLDAFDDFMFQEVIKLRGKMDEIRAAGLQIPGELQSNYDYLFRRMREAKDNTAQARAHMNREDQGDDNTLKKEREEQERRAQRLRLGVRRAAAVGVVAHTVHMAAVDKRRGITVRLPEDGRNLLEELGVVSEPTQASKMFAGMDFGRIRQ